MTRQLDQLAADLLAALRAEQARVDRLAARRRGSRETPPVRWSPMTGEVDRFARALREISQGGQAADYAPGFGQALETFNERHAA